MAYNIDAKITMGDLKLAMERTKDELDKLAEAMEGLGPTGYYPAGSTSFENLPAAGAANVGAVYNITNSFVTTDDFLEGAGFSYPAGTNVAVVKDGDAYKYDVYIGSYGSVTTEEMNEMLDEVFGPTTPED